MITIGVILIVGALVGGRAFYLLEHGELDDPGAWLGTTGFTFYGGFIAAALGIAYYIRRERLSISYLDAIAAGLPLGLAIGRIGDVINGEHYGPASTFFLAVRNSHPDALTPNPELAHHSGGVYEVLIEAIVFAIAWPLPRVLPALGLRRPGARPGDRPMDEPPALGRRGRRCVADPRHPKTLTLPWGGMVRFLSHTPHRYFEEPS